MKQIGKSFSDYLCDVFECSICGFRQLKDGTKCNNPECGTKPKIIWMPTKT